MDATFLIARSPRNVDLAKFSVTFTVRDIQQRETARSVRPVVLPYQSWTIRQLDILIKSPLYVLGVLVSVVMETDRKTWHWSMALLFDDIVLIVVICFRARVCCEEWMWCRGLWSLEASTAALCWNLCCLRTKPTLRPFDWLSGPSSQASREYSQHAHTSRLRKSSSTNSPSPFPCTQIFPSHVPYTRLRRCRRVVVRFSVRCPHCRVCGTFALTVCMTWRMLLMCDWSTEIFLFYDA